MSDKVAVWLEQIGLGEYRQLFSHHHIHWELLPDLDLAILKEIGIESAGHRLRILKAIRQRVTESERGATTGDGVRSEPAGSEAEHRQLTVMFCDLVGSTELSQRFDPEDLRDINRAYQDACKGAIERFEGFVARYMGDGVLAYFGYPRAHEDDAERAILAGLAVADAVAALDCGIGAEMGVELSVRVGIATGAVVVGDLIGEGASQESAVVGETPNLAARLQSLASPGAVVVSPATHHLCAGRFEYNDLGTHPLKGIAEPVRAWRAVAPVAAHSRFDVRSGLALTPLHGRQPEVNLILDRWRTARSGAGQIVLLSGEAGIGKSRIAQAIREHLAAEPYRGLRFQCSPHHVSSALYPIIHQLRIASGFTREDSAAQQMDKLQATLRQSGRASSEISAFFASLLSISAHDEHLPHVDMSPRELREGTLDALIDQLEGLTAQAPVLLELEDVHWIDPTTLELMTRVAEIIKDLPVLMLATFRPEFECPWIRHRYATQIALDRLDDRQSEAIVAVICNGKGLPGHVLKQIVEKTDGVPLFIEELTRTVLESGLLRETNGRYELSGPSVGAAIPSSLQDSLMARLDRLGPAKRLAQIGAAIGREFPRELVRLVCGLTAEELDDDLDRLVDAGLIQRRNDRQRDACFFKHALVQDAAYASLLRRRRQQIHRAIAGHLAERFAEQVEAHPEVLARHFSEGGVPEKAIVHWFNAGRRASRRFANKEARNHLEQGLHALRLLPESRARDQMELELRVALGTVLRMTEGPGAEVTQVNYNKAIDLCDRLPESPEQFAALWGKWVNAMNFKLELGLEWTDRLLALSTKLDDPGFLLQAHHAQWTTLFHLGRFGEAYSHTREGLEFYDEDAHRHHASLYGGHDPRICGGAFAAHALWMLGLPEQSLAYAARCADWGKKLDHVGSALHVIEAHLLLYQFRREPENLAPWIERLEHICSENDLPEYQGKLNFNQGWLLASRGDTPAGIALMRNGLDNQRNVGSLEDIPMFSERLATVLAGSGDIDDGLHLLAEARKVADAGSLRYWLAEVHRRTGELLRRQGEIARAEQWFRDALAIANRQEARILALRAVMSIARLHADHGNAAAGLDVLNPMLQGFAEGSDCLDIQDARALAESLGSAR